MTLIRFESSNINDIQNKFKQENNEILEALEKIHMELYEVETILKTPRSTEIIPKQIEIFEKMEEYIREKDIYFDNVFNTAKNEYAEFDAKAKSMMGDVNG